VARVDAAWRIGSVVRMSNWKIVNFMDVEDVVAGRLKGVAPEVVRSFEAGAEALELIAVGGPKPEGGDGNVVDNPWPDD
jgi:hypothetical protein